jgi:hypothetical protein
MEGTLRWRRGGVGALAHKAANVRQRTDPGALIA